MQQQQQQQIFNGLTERLDRNSLSPDLVQVTFGTSSDTCALAFRSSRHSIAIRWLGSIRTSSPAFKAVLIRSLDRGRISACLPGSCSKRMRPSGRVSATLRTGPPQIVPQCLNHSVGFVDKHLRADFEVVRRDTRVHRVDDAGHPSGGQFQQDANAVRRRGQFWRPRRSGS